MIRTWPTDPSPDPMTSPELQAIGMLMNLKRVKFQEILSQPLTSDRFLTPSHLSTSLVIMFDG